MARNADSGPYAVGNVRIITHEENSAEQVEIPEARAKMSAARRSAWEDPAYRAKTSAAMRSAREDPAYRAKRSAVARGLARHADGRFA
jgi:hypothetical protein